MGVVHIIYIYILYICMYICIYIICTIYMYIYNIIYIYYICRGCINDASLRACFVLFHGNLYALSLMTYALCLTHGIRHKT